jgi:hypothetical protein
MAVVAIVLALSWVQAAPQGDDATYRASTMPIDFKARASLNKGYADKLSSGTLEDLIREFMRAESPRRREYTIVVGENVYHAAEVES